MHNGSMENPIVIAGGGIGGLAAALACARTGWPVHVLERTRSFSEVGAGVQLGPNVVNILHAWGLEQQLRQVASFPELMQVRSALNGHDLASMQLGERTRTLYAAPYATIHRADLHQMLLHALLQHADVELHLGQWLQSFADGGGKRSQGVGVQVLDGPVLQAEALIGADGLWSTVRQILLKDRAPRVTGHLAHRALVRQSDLPEHLRSQHITVWLGPDVHVVQYPVRRGVWLNVVAITKGVVDDKVDEWDVAANAKKLQDALHGCVTPLRELVEGMENWRLWALCDRAPMAGAHEHARGRVALLGDAAHPMRPYMAQGAGMALEDAACLQHVLALPRLSMVQRLEYYAQQRWRRNARVQARSIRNGQIFHAKGVLRWGRDLSLQLLGERLLDAPWLYRGAPR